MATPGSDGWLEAHEIHQRLDDLVGASSTAASTSQPDGEQPWHDRDRRVVAAVEMVRKRLETAPEVLVSRTTLDTLIRHAQSATDNLRGFTDNAANNGPLAAAEKAIEDLLHEATRLPSVPGESEAAALAAATRRARETAEQAIAKAQGEIQRLTLQAESEQKAHDAELAATRKQHETEVAALKTSLTEARSTLDNLLAELGTARSELDTAQEEAREEWRGDALQLVAELEKYKIQAAALLSETAGLTTSVDYAERAGSEKETADRWRLVAIVATLAGVTAAGWLLSNGEQDWIGAVRGLVISGGVFAIAAYAGRQSGQHRRQERWASRSAMELNALEPFIVNMSEDERVKARNTFAANFFNQLSEEPTSKADEPVTVSQFAEAWKTLKGILGR